jgi:hypothetical protein
MRGYEDLQISYTFGYISPGQEPLLCSHNLIYHSSILPCMILQSLVSMSIQDTP